MLLLFYAPRHSPSASLNKFYGWRDTRVTQMLAVAGHLFLKQNIVTDAGNVCTWLFTEKYAPNQEKE
jgi:hypothetical protein